MSFADFVSPKKRYYQRPQQTLNKIAINGSGLKGINYKGE
jgi:hypothetical protein